MTNVHIHSEVNSNVTDSVEETDVRLHCIHWIFLLEIVA